MEHVLSYCTVQLLSLSTREYCPGLVWKATPALFCTVALLSFPSHLSMPSCWELWLLNLELAYRRHQSTSNFWYWFRPQVANSGSKSLCSVSRGEIYQSQRLYGVTWRVPRNLCDWTHCGDPISFFSARKEAHKSGTPARLVDDGQLTFLAPEITPPEPGTWLEKKQKNRSW